MNLIPLTVIWGIMAVVVLGLFIWRKAVARHEDDNVHLLDSAAVQQTVAQVQVAHKLEVIDKWGKLITILALVYGLALAGLYAYQVFVTNTTVGV